MLGSKGKQKKGRKVDCSKPAAPFKSLSHINFPLDTVFLGLNENEMNILKQGSFNELSSLVKLNVSSNHISILEPGAFQGLSNLKKLDLSNNKIGTINSSMFTGLPKLEKLSLANNRINTIPEGTFNDLTSLRRVDFGSDFLRCDCHLRWMVKWSKNKQVRIPSSTVCALPKAMKGRIFSKLKKVDLHCDHDLQLPYFEITPSHSQVVFEGDKLPFECSASVLHSRTNITWLRGAIPVTSNKTAGIFVHTQYTPDKTRITHSLAIKNLDKSHSGQWYCQVSTPQGKVSQGVNISVISNQAVYCPEVIKVTNKGNYSWEKTVAGIEVSQPCKSPKTKLAKYQCNRFGYWEDLDVSQCSYMSEMTRQLERLASVDFNTTDIYDYLADLEKIFTIPKPRIFGVMDVVFLARIVEKLQDHLSVSSEISQIIVSKVSSISSLETSVLRSAQLQEQASTRFVRVLQNISNMVEIEPPNKEWSKYSRNIAIMVLQEPRANPSRIQCSLRKLKNIKKRKNNTNSPFACNRLGNDTEIPLKPEKNSKLSVILPPTLFNDAGLYYEESPKIQIIVYRDGSLFPSTTSLRGDPVFGDKNWSVASNVVTVSVGHPVLNLSEPAILYFEIARTRKPLAAAYWDFDANGGLGDWRSDGCDIISTVGNLTTVYCYHLATFTLLQDDTEYIIRESFVMEPVIYVGSCLCMLCMMVVIITYITCFRVIYIPKKLKHSVINICISVHLLIVAFTLGINRTDLELACQIAGICIHYLTLCAVFWITITSNNMYKKFTKAEKPPEPPPELINMPLPPKPILRFYFLGWGVPIIICGITAAVNFNHYLGIDYCFLAWEPSLGAFYGPITLLVVLNLIFFLRISCVIRGANGNASEQEDCTEELHVNEIELVPSQADTNLEVQTLTPRRQRIERERVKDDDDDEEDDNESTLSVMDQERRPITQLRAIVAMLFLYILAWVCGAIAVAKPFKSIIPYQELIFSYLYGATSTALGVFMVVYFCLSRQDSRLSWKRFFGCTSPELYSMPVNTEPPAPTPPQVNGNIIKSSSNMNLSTHSQKSTNIEKANSMKQNQNTQSKQSNINLVPQTNSSVTEVSINSGSENLPSFYNPRQNGAAKKFWDKNKHKQGKVMNKDANRDINCSSISDELSRHYSQGSDANTHLSIEIQIQQANGGVYGQNMTPNFQQPNRMTPNHFKRAQQVYHDRNHMTPTGVVGSEHGTASPVSFISSHILPQHQRSNSSCSVGSRPSAFIPVQPRNNTLPRPGRGETPDGPTSPNTNNNNYMNREGSVPRLRDFDGQSQVSGSGHQDPRKSPLPPNMGPNLPTPPPQYPNKSKSPVHQNNDIKRGRQSPYNVRTSPYNYRHSPNHRPMSGEYSSDASSRRSRGRHPYFREAPVGSYNPVAGGRQSPAMSDSTQSQHGRAVDPRYLSPDSDSQNKEQPAQRPPETDHHSDPTHRKRHRSSRERRQSNKLQGMRKQKSLGWDNEFKGRPAKQYSYAYVNHNYRDRVLRKLIKQASESDDLAKKAFWLPRSLSEYDRLCQSGFCKSNMVEDSSTSSDEEHSVYDIWVPQENGKDKFSKKETSV
ncbi:hypothetical protein SNE40_012804 [Patella caerulea]|uniref:Adhesion G protein-coupled receptor A3 n=1 Tax=Patella caerulea TaxID=87958 RepID=A0AAN8PW33_PATCE